MAQSSYITSHRARVKKANAERRRSPERMSIFDREALVEFYLLEDIVRLYEFRLQREKAKVVTTRGGEMAKDRNLKKFAAIINIFKTAIEIAWSEIDSGNYKSVWRAIHEGALMSAAKNTKNLPELRALAVEMLKELSGEALAASEENAILEESLDALEAHEANVTRIKGLPTADEINEVIRAVEAAIPDEIPKHTTLCHLQSNSGKNTELRFWRRGKTIGRAL